jgi:hypothetical protein
MSDDDNDSTIGSNDGYAPSQFIQSTSRHFSLGLEYFVSTHNG